MFDRLTEFFDHLGTGDELPPGPPPRDRSLPRSSTDGPSADRWSGDDSEPIVDDTQNVRSSVEDLLDRSTLTKDTVVMETGLHPESFLVEVVRLNDGRVWQGDLIETTGWSASTVSRMLASLEEDGRIERRWIGSRKIVYLPETGPSEAVPVGTMG